MNREIKFRFWDKAKKKWANVSERIKVCGEVDFAFAWLWGMNESLVSFTLDLLNWDALEYTGFEDRNGIGIFEGYIIDGNSEYNTKFPAPVFWDGNNGSWMVGDDLNKTALSVIRDMEIVGNIYENKAEIWKEK